MMPLPTELQCLAQRMRATAQELARAAASLPDVYAAATGWEIGMAVPQGVNLVAIEMLAQARTLEFDAQRLESLADAANDDDRMAYSHTMVLVDACRMARGRSVAAPPDADGHGLLLELAGTVEDGLADIQQLLADRFPGEAIPGD
jgi:hypothetical protein